MKKFAVLGLSAAAMLAAPLGSARADLVSVGQNPFTGTGIGTVNTILTVTSQGNATVEAGCVSFGGVIGSMVSPVGPGGTGGVCSGSTADVQTGASQTQTRTLAQAGVTAASNFGIILNAAEPAGNAITVDALTVTFFSSTGMALFQASLAGPVTFNNTFTGTGTSGFLFMLDAMQQAQATAAGAFSAQTNVIGLRAQLSQATGGQETFFVANTGTIAVIPEPSTYALMATGLLGLGVAARRRRSA